MVWASLRGWQLPLIEVLRLSPQFQPHICIIRSTALEQQERVKGPGTTGAAAADLAAGSHSWWCRLALDHAQLGSPQHFLLSCVSMAHWHIKSQATSAWILPAGSRCLTSLVYPVVCTHPGIAKNACSPTQNCELAQSVTRLSWCVILLLLLLLSCTVLRCEL